jgi:signal transduction histidine kinase
MTEESASHWLTDGVLADLHLTVVHAGSDLAILTHTPVPDVWIGAWGESLRGRALTEVFPELIGSEEELKATCQGQAPRFDLPLINRVDAQGNCRYFSVTAFAHPALQERLVLLVHGETERGELGQQVMQQLNEIRLLRRELETANARLVRLDADKSAFVRMAAHDLRSPLAVIRGYVELVLQSRGSRLGKETAENLGIVLSRTQQMAQLIDNLLDVERIESGEGGLCQEPLDLGVLVVLVAQSFLRQAQQCGLALEWKSAPDLPAVLADRLRLEQVLSNLLGNACKFTPAGGRVTIEALAQEGVAVVEINDTGPGISEADQARLFQRFYRTDEARLRGIPGHGLGLSIVRAIVEQHGGRVYCRSQVGQGSTFGFTVPLA